MTQFCSYVGATETPYYGITDATPAQIASASRVIDGYLGRPEGLLWSPDANGMPAFMANLTPTRSYKLASSISAGAVVQITIPNAQFGLNTVGEGVILDRANSAAVEACLVTAASGNAITLQGVQFAHTLNATVEFGLTLLDEVCLKQGSGTVHAARSPVAQIFGGFSRPRSGSLPRQITDMGFSHALDPTIVMNASPSWTQMDTSQWDINYNTGAIMVLPCPLQYGALDVRLRYVAGWSATSIPSPIKQAVANIVRAAIDTPFFTGNMKMVKAGDSTLERFAPSAIDAETKMLLQPYRMLRIA